jgi:D-apiose dehydrogenase
VTEVYAHLRRLNPVIRGEETGQVFFRFASGATAIWDANRYNEVECPSPRYTFGQMRIDAMGGHLALDTESKLRLKLLGQLGMDVEYPHENVNFAADCVYTLQRHFVECMQSGGEFESTGEDYLKTLRVVDAVYESARLGQAVKV